MLTCVPSLNDKSLPLTLSSTHTQSVLGLYFLCNGSSLLVVHFVLRVLFARTFVMFDTSDPWLLLEIFEALNCLQNLIFLGFYLSFWWFFHPVFFHSSLKCWSFLVLLLIFLFITDNFHCSLYDPWVTSSAFMISAPMSLLVTPKVVSRLSVSPEL